jgi:hypothetical protein
MGIPTRHRRWNVAAAEQLFGSSRRWARDASLVGAWTGWSGAVLMWLSLGASGPVEALTALFSVPLSAWALFATPVFLGAGVAGGIVGALLGMAAPTILDRLRGRVPLPVLAAGLPVLAAAMATGVAVVAAALLGIPAAPAIACGVATTAVQVAAFWLPYTVASVVGTVRWPVLGVASAVGPFTGFLAALLLGLV